jgi:prevent-host-death family protein
MVHIADDIESLSTFKRDTASMVRRLKRTKRPVVLTVNGKAAIVVQDAASYQALLEIKQRYETLLAIEEGLEDVRQGRHRPAKQVFAAVRERLGLDK